MDSEGQGAPAGASGWGGGGAREAAIRLLGNLDKARKLAAKPAGHLAAALAELGYRVPYHHEAARWKALLRAGRPLPDSAHLPRAAEPEPAPPAPAAPAPSRPPEGARGPADTRPPKVWAGAYPWKTQSAGPEIYVRRRA